MAKRIHCRLVCLASIACRIRCLGLGTQRRLKRLFRAAGTFVVRAIRQGKPPPQLLAGGDFLCAGFNVQTHADHAAICNVAAGLLALAKAPGSAIQNPEGLALRARKMAVFFARSIFICGHFSGTTK